MSWVDLSFTQARAFLLRKGVVTREVWDRLLSEERALSWTITGVNKLDVLQHIYDRLTEAVGDGGTLRDFTGDVDEILSTAGLDPLSPWRAETVFRTGVQSAYGRGRYEQMTDPDIASEVYGWRYVTVGDDRVRDEHAALEGRVFRTGEADYLFPPIDFNCRCSTEVVFNDEVGPDRFSPIPIETLDSIRETSFVSPAVSYDYRPDLSGYHPALVSEFQREQRERE